MDINKINNSKQTTCIHNKLNDKKNKAFLLLVLSAVALSLLDYRLIDQVNNIVLSIGGHVKIVDTEETSFLQSTLNDTHLNQSNDGVRVITKDQIDNTNHNITQTSSYCTQKPNNEIRTIPSNIVPYLDGHRSWSKYLHFQIYTKGVPAEIDAINFCDRSGNVYAYQSYTYNPPDISSWEPNQTLWKRSGRFPSVQERIRYYMGSFYDKINHGLFDNFNISAVRCKDILNVNDTHVSATYCLSHELANSSDPNFMFDFVTGKLISHSLVHGNSVPYTRDIIDLAIIRQQLNATAPVFVHFGDGVSSVTPQLNLSFPVFGKVRDLNAVTGINHTRYGFNGCGRCIPVHSNIIWPLNRQRHFKLAAWVPLYDMPFENKTSKLIWRGRMERESKSLEPLPLEYDSWKQRVHLVQHFYNSSLVDAKFTGTKARDDIDDNYMDRKRDINFLLQYKYFLAIEGNDVSSGLKWMLFSNSVVFIPPVTMISWAMESLLQPFVHYIPIYANLTNLEEMIAWAENNPVLVKRIAQRSTLFIYDLLFHPDAYRDEELILEGIVRQYEFQYGLV